MADLHPEFARNVHHEDYALLAITAMAASGAVRVGESWRCTQLAEALETSQYTVRMAIELLEAREWVMRGTWANRHMGDKFQNNRSPSLWQPTQALYDTVSGINTELLQTSGGISVPYTKAVRAHIHAETANTDIKRNNSRATRLREVRSLASLQERPSGEWLADADARLAWDALTQIVAHNNQWMATDKGVETWLQYIQE